MNSLLQDMTLERDSLELNIGDALDIKAGILLAMIAVLASLSGIFFAIPKLLSDRAEIAQLVSILCLALACIFAVLTVIPRTYLLSETPCKYAEWVDSLGQYYPSESEREIAMRAGIVQKAAERIESNLKINKKKSKLLALSFWPALAALVIDVGTLVLLGTIKVLS
jgi:hypothetical protein